MSECVDVSRIEEYLGELLERLEIVELKLKEIERNLLKEIVDAVARLELVERKLGELEEKVKKLDNEIELLDAWSQGIEL